LSFSWLLVRGTAANPGSLKFTALMNKQNIAENEVFKPERRDPDIISKHTDDLVLVKDDLSFTKLNTKTNKYYGPFEPDGVNLKYWCRFNHIAKRMKDESFSGNYTIPHGNPKLIRGPDDGVKGGVIMSMINSLDSQEYYQVPDNVGLRVSGLTTGFSIYLAFIIQNDFVGEGGAQSYTSRGIKPLGFKTPGIKLSFYTTISNPTNNATVAFKVDDITPTNGWWVRVGANGELKFFVLRAGVVYNFISAGNKIKKGQLYECTLTYTIAGNVLTMRINNEVQVDSANETPTFPANHNLDLWIASGPETIQEVQEDIIEIPIITKTEIMEGVLKDIRKYDNLIFSSTQQDNIWNNKRSISPIAFGKLAVAGYAFFNENVYAGGFDSTGYDSTGYDTT
jgi:hypothetical protein